MTNMFCPQVADSRACTPSSKAEPCASAGGDGVDDPSGQPALTQLLVQEFARLPYRLTDEPKRPEADLAAQKAALVRASPFRGDIYLPTEKIPLPEQVSGLRRVAQLAEKDNLEVSRERFERLRHLLRARRYRRVFVIGNGPSLKMTDLALLKDEITIAFNGIFLHESFTPTIYVVEDHLVAEDRQREIHDFRCPVKIFPSYLGYCISPQENTIFLNHRSRISYPVDTDFSDDAGRISYTGGTVTYTGLQIAASLGFEEIVLIGVDASYRVHNVERSDQYGTGVLTSKEDDVNHFDPRYFGKGYRWHDPNVHTMLQAYRKAREFGRDNGVRIVNASLGGELEVFERVDYHRLFERQRVHPRLAVLDFTSVHRLSATGVVKKNLLEGWPKSAQFHVFADEKARLVAFQHTPHDLYAPGSDDNSVWPAFRSLVEYDPGVLYLRPTLDRVPMTVLQVVAAAALGKPWVVHYMDDWLAKAATVRDAPVAAAYRQVMAYLFEGAGRVLSISEKMSRHLIETLSVQAERVTAIHNYASPPASSPHRTPAAEDAVRVVRYFGGLEPDMGLATVLEVARQISVLNQAASGPRYAFEIVTSPYQIGRQAAAFASAVGTSLIPQYTDYADYLAALSSSDLNLICYNFDDRSLDYVRFSLANKLPELLASGAPFIAIGHPEIATIELLRTLNYPLVLDEERFDIAAMLERSLAPTTEQRQEMAAGLAALKDEFAEVNHRCRFHALLREVRARPPRAKPPMAALRTLLNSVADTLHHSRDLDVLMRLPLVRPDVLRLALSRIRNHGRAWSVRDELAALGKALKSPVDLASASADLQARALSFLVSSLGHERYETVNTIVRAWLQSIDLDVVHSAPESERIVDAQPVPGDGRRYSGPSAAAATLPGQKARLIGLAPVLGQPVGNTTPQVDEAPQKRSGSTDHPWAGDGPALSRRMEFTVPAVGPLHEAIVLLSVRPEPSPRAGQRLQLQVREEDSGDAPATLVEAEVNGMVRTLCVRHPMFGRGTRLLLEVNAVDPAGPRFQIDAHCLIVPQHNVGLPTRATDATLHHANLCFQDQSYEEALLGYLDLHGRYGFEFYLSNALMCAGKLAAA